MLGYFPLRFIICNLLYSFIYLYFIDYIQNIEVSIQSQLLKIMGILVQEYDNTLVIGNIWQPIEINIIAHIHGIYLVVLLSFMSSVNTSVKRRVVILLFTILMFIIFVLGKVLIMLILLLLNNLSQISFIQVNVLTSAITGAIITESMLYSILAIPKRVKVRRLIKRKMVYEYLKISIVLINTILMLYIFMNVFNFERDSPLAAYAAIQISSLLIYTNYIGFVLREIKIPTWSKITTDYKPIITFIIPAYNEEKFIERCITSIDNAAKNYNGTTEIIIVDDGSTDNTPLIIDNAIKNLKYSKGIALHIPNSGKSKALNVGLKNASGEIIFRIDADSYVDERFIVPIVRHFKDPEVGAVSGIIYGVEEKYIWQKFLVATLGDYIFTRRSQEFFDTIMVQPGAFSVFRRKTIEELGGWGESTFGEDRDLTFRISRLGYKNEFEDQSLIYSDIPRTLKELRKQRVRWNIGFYFSHARNLDIIKERLGTRSIIFIYELINHGSALATFVFWSYLLMAALLGFELSFSSTSIFAMFGLPVGLFLIDIISSSLLYIIYIYFLIKHKKYNLIKYVPLLKIYQFVLLFFFVEATNLLSATKKDENIFENIRSKIRKL
ncbi:MAG: glycosyltransferase [Candidatus Nitrosocaldaceae archaeon]